MIFSSLVFLLIFLPSVLLIYFVIPGRNLKNLVLLMSSLFFYAWGEPIYVLLMVFSIFNDYYHSLFIDKVHKKGQDKKATILLMSSVIINLGLLFFFKYSGFLIDIINTIFSTKFFISNLTLPIGISFYTFQTMSYTIDVYRKKVNVQKNILTLGTYVALFPQLVAGPIVRYITIEDELSNRKESFELFSEGLRKFIFGLGKKVIIANQTALIADNIFNNGSSTLGWSVILLGTLAYTLQIYFDFSGYSDMAIGLGKMFGFNFHENFKYPYTSKSITDFWRRWHISLGTWFKDYVYIPLGGNRTTSLVWYRNIFIVWFLTGLWHGAAFNYILWGLYFGIILILEKRILLKKLQKLPNFFQHAYTIALFMIGWIIFRIEDVSLLLLYLKNLFTFNPGNPLTYIYNNPIVIGALPYVILGIIGSTSIYKKIDKKNEKKDIYLFIKDIYLLFILLLSIAFLVSNQYNPFIYFRF